jgi:oxygen-independent coproporphyrinogen-3 oxidase
MRSFVEAVILDITKFQSSPLSKGINTIYIGGGTPTSLPGDCLRELLEALSPFVQEVIEFTCEANPDSASLEKLGVLRDGGVNRLSLGMQSFSDDFLQILGRLHNNEIALRAFNVAREAGFNNISIDLMYGLPEQDITDWTQDLEKAIDLGCEHISFYALTIEEGTKFDRLYGKDAVGGELPGEDAVREMYYRGIDVLEDAGYKQYELSNFAGLGFESQHNLNYWRHGKYFAIGPSAAGFDSHKRWKVVPDTGEYIKAVISGVSPIVEEEVLSADKLISEAVMLGLRLKEGINLMELSERFSRDIIELYSETIQSLEKMGILEVEGDVIRLSGEGLFVSNQVISEFMLV